MPDSKASQAKRSGNAAELLAQFRKQQAQHNENCIEVSAVYEHLLEDIERRPSTFAFTKDEILDGLNEVWPHIGKYIQNLDVLRAAFEKELYEETANNCQLRDENEDLQAQILILETQIESLQTPTFSECISTPPPTTESPLGSNPPLASPVKVQYSHKRSRKLDKNEDFRNKVGTVTNALREDSDRYFLKEDVDVTAWLNKVIGELPCQAIMLRMKDVFGNHMNFEMVFSGFDPNLLCAEMHHTRWITDASTPLHIGSQVTKGIKGKSPYKSKKPVTGSGQSKPSVHAPTPTKTGESSWQQLDAELETYGQVHKQVLPYDEAPPSGEPKSGETVPPSGGATSTLHDESTMDIDQIMEDIYRDC
ncbi:hypothetical protein M422DRAFT_255740 [Sphaerobolus stellatus SS14]|uniref:Uncharacterized protein n=1 Tax=Sphaerobolus stellatus (strain SS14) TaxID=990650 RepID=A0A0C9VT29_SPHS4|nr:hypothetical protein M422DRAFT_255740 [Sphaerobolus stellatus SS14]